MRQRSGWFLALAMLISTCQPDRNPADPGNQVESVPPLPLDVLPTNGGVDPNPIITSNPDSSETIRFEFTVDDSIHNKHIEGQPYGVWFGNGDSIVTNPPTGQANFKVYHSWEVIYNLPSPSHYAAHPASVNQSFLYFEPPVRRVSFSYASAPGDGATGSPPDAFYYRVVSTTGSTLKLDTIHANNPSNDDYSNWDTLTAYSTNEDVIDHIFFNGAMIIDDLEIVREGSPLLECNTVPRASAEGGKCELKDGVADTVLDWRFVGSYVFADTLIATSQANSTIWQGLVVDSGTVTVRYRNDGVTDSASAFLGVANRTDWRWSEADWDLDEDVPPACIFQDWLLPFDGAVLLGRNRPQSGCLSHVIDPPVLTNALDGVEVAQVNDGGPNHGIWYVTEPLYRMDRATELHPWLRDGSLELIGSNSKHDNRKCRDYLGIDKGDPVIINTFDFNLHCENDDLTPMLEAALQHEGYGSVTSGPNANGHESRRRYFAELPEHDPHKDAEWIVGKTEAQLGERLRGVLSLIEADLRSLGSDHTYVTGNWSGSDVWTYDNDTDQFQKWPTGSF